MTAAALATALTDRMRRPQSSQERRAATEQLRTHSDCVNPENGEQPPFGRV
jgi:hypothetical protein